MVCLHANRIPAVRVHSRAALAAVALLAVAPAVHASPAMHALVPVVAAILERSVSLALALPRQKITFGKLSGNTYGAAPFAVGATASSGLPVSFASITTPVCTVSGNIVTIVAAGTCKIRASQAGNATYAAAPNVDQSFTVAKAAQTITFGALGDKTFGAPPFAVSATASSALAVTLSSLTTPVCTVSGSMVTIVALGSCTIRAFQPGNANYKAAPSVDRSFNVVLAAQAITFGALDNKTLGTAPFLLSATASSGLPVAFASLTTSVCIVGVTVVKLVSAGTCTIRASQAGNATFGPAANVDQSFSVATNANVTIQYTYDTVGNLIGVQRVP